MAATATEKSPLALAIDEFEAEREVFDGVEVGRLATARQRLYDELTRVLDCHQDKGRAGEFGRHVDQQNEGCVRGVSHNGKLYAPFFAAIPPRQHVIIIDQADVTMEPATEK